MLQLHTALLQQGLQTPEQMAGFILDELDETGDDLISSRQLRVWLVERGLTSEDQASQIGLYVDPNADEAIQFVELESAFLRATQTPESETAEAEVGHIFQILQEHMQRKHLRIIDLLHQMDGNGDGVIDTEEMAQWLARVIGPIQPGSLAPAAEVSACVLLPVCSWLAASRSVCGYLALSA